MLIKWVPLPETPEDLVVKSKLLPQSGSAALKNDFICPEKWFFGSILAPSFHDFIIIKFQAQNIILKSMLTSAEFLDQK